METRRIVKRGAWLLGAWLLGLLAVATVLSAPAAAADPLGRLGYSIFQGTIHERTQLGAVTTVGRLLVIGSDEGTAIQVLLPGSETNVHVAVSPPIPLVNDSGEIDIEGLAADGTTLYVLGSHSLKRRKTRPKSSHAENVVRLSTVLIEDNRNLLFRLSLDPESGEVTSDIEAVGLRTLMEDDPILGPFSRIPSKENGIDIEGLATDGQKLYLGFRSPVLRGGYVPVMVLSYEKPEEYELRFVDLHGRGIRGMARVTGGFLILAGPSYEEDGTYKIYFWDGRDQVPGKDRGKRQLENLGYFLPNNRPGSPEGIAVLEEVEYGYKVLILRDGLPNGSPTRYVAPRK